MAEDPIGGGGMGMRSVTSSVYRLRHRVGNPLYYATCVSVLAAGLLIGGKREEFYYRSYWGRDRY